MAKIPFKRGRGRHDIKVTDKRADWSGSAKAATNRAKVNLSVKGLNGLRGKIAQLPDAMQEPIKKAILRAARGIRRDARKNLDLHFKRRTGALRKSITYEIADDGLAANIGTPKGTFYGMFLEFGTRTGIPRTRFLGKAAQVHKKRLRNSVRRNLRKVIRAHAKKNG